MEQMQIDGACLEVVRIAAPDDAQSLAPIVFLHEGLGSIAMWRDWPESLCEATGRAGVVYSRRGYGQSSPTPDFRAPSRECDGVRKGRLRPDYLHHEARVVLPALLARLGLANPVLLGHSDGASIALIHASQFPVTACIAMAPHTVVEPLSVASIAQARCEFETGNLRQRLARYHANVDCAFWQWNDVWLSDGFRSFDIRDDCRRITAPVLAIQGSDDAYGTLAQIDHIVLPMSRIQRSVLEQCGHSPHRDQADRTTRLVRDFLEPLA